jgi:hypothetical protein
MAASTLQRHNLQQPRCLAVKYRPRRRSRKLIRIAVVPSAIVADFPAPLVSRLKGIFPPGIRIHCQVSSGIVLAMRLSA